MILTVALIMILLVVMLKADKQFGQIQNRKIKAIHTGLMVFTILITALSLTALFDIVLNFDTSLKKIYIEHGVLSPLLNSVVIIGNNILKVLVLFTVFRLAMRSEKARKLFVTLIPPLFVLSCIQILNDLYVKGTAETSLLVAMIITFGVLILFYAPLFFFYKSENTQKEIFDLK